MRQIETKHTTASETKTRPIETKHTTASETSTRHIETKRGKQQIWSETETETKTETKTETIRYEKRDGKQDKIDINYSLFSQISHASQANDL